MECKNLPVTDDLFRLFVSSVVDYALIVLDPAGNIISWNAGAERIKGYTAEEIVGKHFSVFYTQEDRFCGKPQHQLWMAKKQGSVEDFGWRVCKDGTKFYASVTITPLYDHSSNLCAFAKVTRDITERKAAEEQMLESKKSLEVLNAKLAVARDQAEKISRLKSEFVANVSHEIRTPLNGIIGLSNVLLKTSLDGQQLKCLESIRIAGTSLLVVINDILDFSKIEAGKLELELADFSLLALVESACDLFASQARIKHLSIATYVDPSLPSTMRGDPERLKQILTNLVSNAIKFSESGEVLVKVELDSETIEALVVKFSIVDCGIGLTRLECEKLFKPFVQADGSISRKYGGSGLGLSISKRLTELMNGDIGVVSEHGRGSEFWFRIPLEPRPDLLLSHVGRELRGLRMLIVQDDKFTRDVVQSYASAWGVQTDWAMSPENCLRMLRQAYVDGEPYKIALIDLSLERRDKLGLSRQIMTDPAISSTALIFLRSAETDQSVIEITNGASAFIAYLDFPVHHATLLDMLQRAACWKRESKLRGEVDTVDIVDTRVLAERSNGLILVVEDQAINQQVAQLYLDEIGYRSRIVSSGKDAVAAVDEEDFALILMDCQMPEMDGLTATGLIRCKEKASGRHVPIVAMTAHAMAGDRQRCLSAGMDDYISKPVEPDEFSRIIHKWLPKECKAFTTPPDNIVQFAKLERRYKDRARDMLEMFIEEAPVHIATMNEACAAADFQAIGRCAHGFKGICGALMLSEMKDCCFDLENVARQNDLSQVNNLSMRLEGLFRRVEQVVAGSSPSVEKKNE